MATAASGLALGAARVQYPAEYPMYRASGSHRDLGRQHGEQASSRIKAHVDYMASSGKMSRDQLRTRALKFQPVFDQHCPHLLEEMRGLAEGAGVTLAEAMACNIRGEISHAAEGCTAYVIGRSASAGKEILAGQNSGVSCRLIPCWRSKRTRRRCLRAS